MMISPECYIEEHKNDTFPQLLQAKNELIEDIRKLETIVFDSNHSRDEWGMKPSPDVQYQMCLEYLSVLCKHISEKYNREIVWDSIE